MYTLGAIRRYSSWVRGDDGCAPCESEWPRESARARLPVRAPPTREMTLCARWCHYCSPLPLALRPAQTGVGRHVRAQLDEDHDRLRPGRPVHRRERRELAQARDRQVRPSSGRRGALGSDFVVAPKAPAPYMRRAISTAGTGSSSTASRPRPRRTSPPRTPSARSSRTGRYRSRYTSTSPRT